MSIIHYSDTPLPVGLPMGLNGCSKSYELGLADGSLYIEQWADEPEEGVVFESPKAAKRWLEAVTAVLPPYIESGNREARIPDATGWEQG